MWEAAHTAAWTTADRIRAIDRGPNLALSRFETDSGSQGRGQGPRRGEAAVNTR